MMSESSWVSKEEYDTERTFSAEVELWLIHGPGVQESLEVLRVAQDMDKALQEQTVGKDLTRYFVTKSGATGRYPFMCNKVLLRPKAGVNDFMGINGVAFRYALVKDDENKDSLKFGGNIVVTFGFTSGEITEFVLNDRQSTAYEALTDLKIEEDQLIGSGAGAKVLEFDTEFFNRLIDNMEPELQ